MQNKHSEKESNWAQVTRWVVVGPGVETRSRLLPESWSLPLHPAASPDRNYLSSFPLSAELFSAVVQFRHAGARLIKWDNAEKSSEEGLLPLIEDLGGNLQNPKNWLTPTALSWDSASIVSWPILSFLGCSLLKCRYEAAVPMICSWCKR